MLPPHRMAPKPGINPFLQQPLFWQVEALRLFGIVSARTYFHSDIFLLPVCLSAGPREYICECVHAHKYKYLAPVLLGSTRLSAEVFVYLKLELEGGRRGVLKDAFEIWHAPRCFLQTLPAALRHNNKARAQMCVHRD